MPLGLKIEPPPNSVAPYFVEEVRQQLEKEYGTEEVQGAGLKVYTTLDLDLQLVANKAVLDGTAAYERRHGWKGNLQNVAAAGDGPWRRIAHPDWAGDIERGGYYVHALVTGGGAGAGDGEDRVDARGDDAGGLGVDADEALGRQLSEGWGRGVCAAGRGARRTGCSTRELEQDSGAQASLMAVDNSNGEVLAMVGGRDYALSQFNRATQSEREVGSSFKPYVYTTAVEAGEAG
jgi:penicillin-binding protein 1A